MSHGSSRRCTNTAGCSAKCWSPRSSCNSSPWLRRCSSRSSPTRCWRIEGSLSVGELIAFNMLAGRVAQPVLRLAQLWQDFHQARVSIARLGDILNAAPEPTFNPARAALPPIRGEVTFDHISFRYRVDGALALHDVTLKVPLGQV